MDSLGLVLYEDTFYKGIMQRDEIEFIQLGSTIEQVSGWALGVQQCGVQQQYRTSHLVCLSRTL